MAVQMVQAGASYVVVILWLVLEWRSMQQGAGLAATNRTRNVGQASEEAASEFFLIVLIATDRRFADVPNTDDRRPLTCGSSS
jgi:hypothetical protein